MGLRRAVVHGGLGDQVRKHEPQEGGEHLDNNNNNIYIPMMIINKYNNNNNIFQARAPRRRRAPGYANIFSIGKDNYLYVSCIVLYSFALY